jgi:sodium-dependent dicarboxylate transporter 2/3/5
MLNIGLLKLELMAYGIQASEGLPSPLTNPFGLVHLVLPEKIAVSIHRVKNHGETPFTLKHEGGKFFLEDNRDHKKISVHWTPPLKSYEKKTSSGVLVSDILTVHGGFIAVHPRGPCRFGRSGLSCRYCGSTKELSKHPSFSKRDLIEAIEIILKEKTCDFVHLSSGHVDTEDGGVDWLGPWVTEIRKHLNILISLDLVPPHSNHWIDQAYAIGADALYYDLDFFNPKEAESSHQFQIQRRRHLAALEYAASIFPKGAVLSHVVIGLEPLETTQKSVDLLIERGVVPILVYFPPYPESELASRWTVTPTEVAPLYAHLFEKLVKSKNTPHWIQQFDVVLTPLEGRFFSKHSPGYHLVLKKFYHTRFGRMMRMGLISMRRRLRVRHELKGTHSS